MTRRVEFIGREISFHFKIGIYAIPKRYENGVWDIEWVGNVIV